MSVQHAVQVAVNRALRPTGFQVVRGHSTDPAISPFLPARRTIKQAAKAGKSVGDFLDSYSAEPGATAATVDALLEIGHLTPDTVDRVCEIGPGSGRYTARVQAAVQPSWYEVYETASDWIRYLRGELPTLTFRPTDGHTLAPTPSASVDLVHTHKLLGYIPFVTALGYVDEMARVVRPGGVVAFDLITDDCLDDSTTKVWLTEPHRMSIYSVAPRAWLTDFLAQRNLELEGSRFVPLSGGRTELLVYRRR
ncbi:class I SAM-dependent methyltransferase [Kribbella sp. NPDC048915]|uniref:class I SAM-dependent methyltransferase n=1 Tax=Kribbella sp. NPDC048915 TaxID=3155148 RepID=UPI0034098F46